VRGNHEYYHCPSIADADADMAEATDINNVTFLTDLVVPNLNGLNLISLIRARWSKMPIVLIPGYLSQDAGNIILD
jgi:DNA-binding response OmpR family regulator